MSVCPFVRSSALDLCVPFPSPFWFSKMTIQNQKAQIEEAGEALDLSPLARLIGFVVSRLPTDGDYWASRGDRVAARTTELRRRARLDRGRARQLRDGEDDPAMSPADLKVLAAADRLEAKAAEVLPVKGKPATKLRAEAGRMRTSVSRSIAARGEARRDDLRLAQTVELDATREGEPVDRVLEAKRGQGDKRLRTRDGLKLMHERGGFTPKDAEGAARRDLTARIEADRLLNVGLRYRDRFEIAQSSLKSCLDMSDGVKGSPTLWTQSIAARRRAALANQVRVLDIAVVTRLGPEALLVLRMVAGEARTIRSLSSSSRQREAFGALLPKALVIVGDILARGT